MGRLEQLNTFIAVAEEHSFIRVARRFSVTAAAISKQIAQLEKELGVRLFERTTREIKLSEMGELLFHHAKKLTVVGDEIEGLFSEIHKEPVGCLRIGTSWYFAKEILIPNLSEFFQKYPKISIDVIQLERVPDLLRESIDINIGHTFVGGMDDIHKRIGETRYSYCASPAYLKKFGIPNTPEDLLHHKYLTHCMRHPDDVLEFNGGKEIVLEPFMRFNDSRFMIQATVEGLGIIKLHRYAVKEPLERGELTEILQGWDNLVQPIYLCYRPQKFLPPKIRHFIDFIAAKTKKELF